MTLQEIKNLKHSRYKIFGLFYKIFLVYKLTNKQNSKVYIGLSTNLSKRFKSYLYHGTTGKGQQLIHRAIRKHGLDQFDFEILEIVKNESDLGIREKFWIQKFISNNRKYGYNLTNGGEIFKFSPSVLKRMSGSARNKKKVYIYSINGDFIREFNSINECSRNLKRKHCTILMAIYRNTLIDKKYLASFEKLDKIPKYIDLKSEKISKKLKNNRNCKTFLWKLIDTKNKKVYIEDGIRKLSLVSGYNNNILTTIGYNRIGYKKYKEFLIMEKLNEYEK